MVSRTQSLNTLFLLLSLDTAAASFFSNFNFATLLYKTGACTHVSTFCPAPRCIGPHPPPVCTWYVCSDGGDCTWGATESMCQGDSDCMASTDWYTENSSGYYEDEENADVNQQSDCDGDKEYKEGDVDGSDGNDGNYEEENYEVVNQAEDGYERDYVAGGSDGLNDHAASSSRNFLAYYIIGAILALFIIAVIWRKRDQINNDELSEELHPGQSSLKGSVQRRLTDLETGKSQPVVPLVDADNQTKFIPAEDGSVGSVTTGSVGSAPSDAPSVSSTISE